MPIQDDNIKLVDIKESSVVFKFLNSEDIPAFVNAILPTRANFIVDQKERTVEVSESYLFKNRKE